MLFLSTMEIEQDSSRSFLTGRTALRTRASRMGQKQHGQPLDQGLGVQVARQQVQGVVFDGIEGDRPIDRLGMTGFSRIELGLCRLGQNRFQASLDGRNFLGFGLTTPIGCAGLSMYKLERTFRPDRRFARSTRRWLNRRHAPEARLGCFRVGRLGAVVSGTDTPPYWQPAAGRRSPSAR